VLRQRDCRLHTLAVIIILVVKLFVIFIVICILGISGSSIVCKDFLVVCVLAECCRGCVRVKAIVLPCIVCK
jgi:hypothetical protein